MKEWKVLVLEGTRHGADECGNSIEFWEPYETATPKVIAITAVDLNTCQVELTIGVPVNLAPPRHEGGIATGDEMRATPPKEPDEEFRRGYSASGEIAELLSDAAEAPLTLGNHTRKFTVTSEWRDPELHGALDKTIVDVSQAVRMKIRDGEVEEGWCKSGTWRQQYTLWEQDLTGQWNDTNCNEHRHNVKGGTSAHFKNSFFPGCIPTVHIYYDNFWVRLSDSEPYPEGYTYGMSDRYWTGGPCGALIRWMQYETFPDEYWKFDD